MKQELKFNLFILSLTLFVVFEGCKKDCSTIGPETSVEFIFIERTINTTGEIIEMDTTKFINIRTVEPSMFYSFDQENRILEYRSGVRDRVPIIDELIVWIASNHYWDPPDQMGLYVQMFPIYYEGTHYIDDKLSYGGILNDGTVELSFNDSTIAFYLSIDSVVTRKKFRYKKVPLAGGDPMAPIDSALIKLTDEVKIVNHGYLNKNQVIWKNLIEGE